MNNPESEAPATTLQTRMLLAFVAVALVALALYWPGLDGPFVLDDQQNIVEVHQDEKSWAAFYYAVTHNESGMLGRIVSISSFVLSGWQYGVDPWGYKLENILLHLLTGAVLMQVLGRILQQLDPAASRQHVALCAGVATAFWLLHPLQVSTVLYVVQRMTILAALFLLLALWTYLVLRQQTHWSRRHWLMAFVLFPALQLLAMFSKETGVLLPLFMLACELLVFCSLRQWRQLGRPQLGFLLVFVLFPLLVGGLYFVARADVMLDYSVRNFTLGERLLTQLHVLPLYLRLILLPRVRDMSLFHDDFPVTHGFDVGTSLLLSALILVVVAIFTLRKHAPVLAFGIAWFLTGHLLESTVIPLELVFEHRNYVAMAGLLLPVAYYVLRYRDAKLARPLLGFFLLIFMLQTHVRAREWSNEELMFVQAVADHPASPRARISLANKLTLLGRYGEAMEQLEAAAEADPKDPGPLLHQLFNYCLLGQSMPQLVDKTEKVLAAYPATVYAMNSLDNLFRTIGLEQCTKLSSDDMARLLNAAVGQSGNRSSPLFSGYLLRLQGVHAFMAGQYVQGVVHMRMAHEATGDNMMLVDLVEAQLNYGQPGDAAETLQVLREINAQQRGTETYQIARLEQLLQQARDTPPADSAGNLPQPIPATAL